MVSADQQMRNIGRAPTSEEADKWLASDRVRIKRARQMIENDSLTVPEDFSLAAIIFQHGETADDCLVAHELSFVAGIKGRYGTLAALAEDRYLVRTGRKQRFGTQFSAGPDGKASVVDVDDEPPFAVTDSLRLDLGVVPLKIAEQKGIAGISESKNLIAERMKLRTSPKWIEDKRISAESQLASRCAENPGNEAAKKTILQLYQNDQIWIPKDYAAAAAVLATGSDPQQLLLAHELATVAGMRENKEALLLFATTLDKYLISIDEPERYGTQSSNKKRAGSVGPGIVKALGLAGR